MAICDVGNLSTSGIGYSNAGFFSDGNSNANGYRHTDQHPNAHALSLAYANANVYAATHAHPTPDEHAVANYYAQTQRHIARHSDSSRRPPATILEI